MSDKINSFTVVLDEDISEEQAEKIKSAMMQIKGVIDVSNNVTDIGLHTATQRVRLDIAKKIMDVVYSKK